MVLDQPILVADFCLQCYHDSVDKIGCGSQLENKLLLMLC